MLRICLFALIVMVSGAAAQTPKGAPGVALFFQTDKLYNAAELAYAPDGKSLVGLRELRSSGECWQELVAWDLATRQPRLLEAKGIPDLPDSSPKRLEVGRGYRGARISAFAFHPDGVSLWVARAGVLEQYAWPGMTQTRKVTLNTDVPKLTSTYNGKTYDVPEVDVLHNLVRKLSISADGKTAVVGWVAGGYGVDLIDVATGKKKSTIRFPAKQGGGSPLRSPAECVALMPSGDTVAGVVQEHSRDMTTSRIEFRDATNGAPSERYKTIPLPEARYHCLTVSDDGKHIGVCGGDRGGIGAGEKGWVEVWGVDGKQRMRMKVPDGRGGFYPSSMQFGPSGQHILVLDESSGLHWINFTSWAEWRDKSHKTFYARGLRRAAALSHDGRFAAIEMGHSNPNAAGFVTHVPVESFR